MIERSTPLGTVAALLIGRCREPIPSRAHLAILDRDGIHHTTIDIEPGRGFAWRAHSSVTSAWPGTESVSRTMGLGCCARIGE